MKTKEIKKIFRKEILGKSEIFDRKYVVYFSEKIDWHFYSLMGYNTLIFSKAAVARDFSTLSYDFSSEFVRQQELSLSKNSKFYFLPK